MKERPILFNAPMVRAILSGQKTQTRRAVKLPPNLASNDITLTRLQDGYADGKRPVFGLDDEPNAFSCVCPYGQPGERLIVAMEIPGIGRNYCAGSDGVIYSRARGDWRPLKEHGNDNGYPSVTVMDGPRKTTRAVHTLICTAFYGPAPFKGAQVRHLDGDTTNSLPGNLAWGTQEENWRDRRAHGNGMEGEKHHAAKLTDVERASLRWAIQHGLCSQRHAARVLDMTQSAIGQMMDGSELKNVQQDVPTDRVSLITLEIVSVRVERLQDISETDAKAEGVDARKYHGLDRAYTRAFSEIWESTGGDWASNPWVWALSFSRVTP